MKTKKPSDINTIVTGSAISVWSPMKKANLKTWKSAQLSKKTKASSTVTALRDDRALVARFLMVVLSRPGLDVKESISNFELAEYPRALFYHRWKSSTL